MSSRGSLETTSPYRRLWESVGHIEDWLSVQL